MYFDFLLQPGKSLNKRIHTFEDKPLVSIITPFYNCGKNFSQTFNCVLNQTFPYFEWIIVNDGSTNQDDIDLLNDLASKDRRITVLHKENGGASSSRNLGIQNSKTKYILPLDADDLIDPTYIECNYFALVTNPDAGWSYTDCVGFGTQEYLWKKEFSSKIMKQENLLAVTALIKKDILLNIGLYDLDEKHSVEDWILWLKLLTNNVFPIHLGYYGFWYRRNDTGVFSIVKNNPKLNEKLLDTINKVSKNVSNDIYAKQFPDFCDYNFNLPVKFSWNRNAVYSKNKTKVLMIIPWMIMGGADAFNLDIVSRIDKDIYEISIITTVPSDCEWRQRFEEHATDIFDLTTFLNVKDWSAFIHYFITSRDINIIMISNSYYGYYIMPWLRKEFPTKPIIDYVHMEEWYWKNGGFGRACGALRDILDKTYVCSNHLKNTLCNSFNMNKENIDVVYINVDEKIFNPDNYEYGKIKREVNIDINSPVILFPCRLVNQKRPYLMIEIAKKVIRQNNNIYFFIIGDGLETDNIKKLIKLYKLQDNIILFGPRNDMAQFYHDSSITLICSMKEGLSLTSYESLAMGTPVVTSDVGGQKELIDNTVGRIVPLLQDEVNDWGNLDYSEEEINLYVDSIFEILNNNENYQMLKQNCRNKILNGFTKDHMIKKIQSEFNDLLNGNGKERRDLIAKSTSVLSSITDDYLTLYCEYNKLEFDIMNYTSLLNHYKNMYNNSSSLIKRIKFLYHKSINKTIFGRCFRKFKSIIKKVVYAKRVK